MVDISEVRRTLQEQRENCSCGAVDDIARCGNCIHGWFDETCLLEGKENKLAGRWSLPPGNGERCNFFACVYCTHKK